MADSRFFSCKEPQLLSRLQALTACTINQEFPLDLLIKDVAPLKEAETGDITFYHNTKYRDQLKTTKATACFIHPDHIKHAPDHLILLLLEKPYRAYARIASFFYESNQYVNYSQSSQNFYISPTAKVGKNTIISPFCVLEDGVEVGDNCFIGPHCVLQRGVKIGTGCILESHVTISYSLIGDQVYIKSGARLGQKGFGFEMDEKGHISVPQIGRLLIGDRVEIGSNTTIDRGSKADTIIGSGCRIDNLVQIAHNVVLGENCVIVAQVGIAGSTQLGRYVVAAGQVGIVGHLKIGDSVRIAAQSGISRDISDGQTVAGTPAVPIRDWHKQTIALSKLIKDKEMK